MNDLSSTSSDDLGVDVDMISHYSDVLAASLDQEMRRAYRPTERKTLRKFTAGEVSEYTGITASNLRTRHKDGSFPEVETDARGHRLYSAEEIAKIRDIMFRTGKNGEAYKPGRRDGDEMQVISVVNFKGGSSKTTTCIHLAQRYALRGYRVLAIDMDAQGSLTTFFGYRPELDFEKDGEFTIYDALAYEDPASGIRRADLKQVIRKTYFPNLDIAPASLILAEYETETANALSQNAMGRAAHSLFAVRLTEALLSARDDYDLVLIDCPPQLGFTTLTALAASNGLLVTVVPGMLDIASMSQFLKLAAETMRAINESTGGSQEWDFLKFLITRYEPSDGPQTQMSSYLRHLLGSLVMVNPMLKSTAISDAGMTHQTIYEVDPKQLVRTTLDRARNSVNAVADELEVAIQKVWAR
ncbi:plasmid partitioning protein RepA [Paracoccus litorisediminis]|jgi:chromosome partitioning protein|uniref:Plasmid partitioning protein RepA n=1 Tax=Paracoccus litorisediminis TaxID=2006130 RepID=A0A844HPF3_9RHOB|nr:plasmid partitioning protein RepA [Paracoccus litorisediminis]MTH61736.1 plasmid partitioning protein RepA [Paracoccus litorisediminis]